SACCPSSTPLPASVRRPTIQAMPRPTRRGCRTHQKAMTSATKSGTSRMSRQGRKLRKSASTNDPMMVLVRTGSRICDLLIIGSLFGALVPALAAARLLGAALLLLRLVRPRRHVHLRREHEHIATAIHARHRPAEHACERLLGVGLDLHHRSDREAGGVGAVDAGSDQAVAILDLRVGADIAQLEHAGLAA